MCNTSRMLRKVACAYIDICGVGDGLVKHHMTNANGVQDTGDILDSSRLAHASISHDQGLLETQLLDALTCRLQSTWTDQ